MARVIRTGKGISGTTYRLHDVEGYGHSLWIGAGDDAVCVLGDLPPTAREDFETYVDEADEELRVEMAQLRAEFRSSGGAR